MFLIVPVHHLHQPFMFWLRIKDPASFPIQVMDLSHTVCPADLPVFRHRNLVKIPGPAWYSRRFSKVTEKESIYGYDVFRQKSVILDDHGGTFISCLPKGSMKILAFLKIIIKKQNYIAGLNSLIHRFSTSSVRYPFAFS